MERININKIEGLSGFKLSHIVASLEFIRPNTRGQHRPDKVKKAVLRALCDRYPNVWPGVEDIARKASCGTTQTRRALRELEHKDRLIVDISTEKGKRGGRGSGCTVQYFVRDRKILDIYEQAKWFEKNAPIENQKPDGVRMQTQRSQNSETGDKPNGVRSETQRSESQKPTVSEFDSGLNPTDTVAEPIRVLTEKNEPTREREPQPPLSRDYVEGVEADCKQIRMQLARNCWQATPQTEQIARAYLKDGHSKESVWKAIEATMSAMPSKERHPGLYLAQNLRGNMDLLITGEAPRHAETRSAVASAIAAALADYPQLSKARPAPTPPPDDCRACRGTGWKDRGDGKHVLCQHAAEDRRPSPPVQESEAESLQRIAALDAMLKGHTRAAANS